MEMRVFGRTGMRLSVLGFGCGAVGGLMVRGDALEQERTVARAIAVGVNYFDTAVQYGTVNLKRTSAASYTTSRPPTWSSVLRSGSRVRSSAVLPMLWRRRWKAA